MERNKLSNFGRGHYEIHLCKIILNLGQWFRTIFSISSSGGHFVQWSRTILFSGGQYRENLCEILVSGSDVISRFFPF